jgi:hypothetical protein
VEPSQGNYDFSEIQSDLDYAASQGMQLIVWIEDKTFVNEHAVPLYLQSSQYERPNDGGGYTAIRWNSTVANSFKALLVALGNQFNGHPAFEGVMPGSESAPSLPGTVLDETGYTPEKYRDVFIDVFTAAARSMPDARVIWLFNFFPRKQEYIADVASALLVEGVAMGGPDDRPDDDPLIRLVFPYYDQFKDSMDLMVQVEPSCYNHLHAGTNTYWTPQELFEYARDTLHVKDMWWVRFPGWGSGGYGYQDALPVIADNPVFNQ